MILLLGNVFVQAREMMCRQLTKCMQKIVNGKNAVLVLCVSCFKSFEHHKHEFNNL